MPHEAFYVGGIRENPLRVAHALVVCRTDGAKPDTTRSGRNRRLEWTIEMPAVKTAVMKISQLTSVGDIVTRFRENWTGYLRQYRFFLALLLLASLADMASTIHFMLVGGPEAEGHPVVRMLSRGVGPILGPILSKATQFLAAVAVTVFLRRWTLYILIPLIILYAWAAWYNVWGGNLYYPRLARLLEYLAI